MYIEQSCRNCSQARELADWVRENVPEASAEMIDLSEVEIETPSSAFAVPTYLPEGRILFLGIPAGRNCILASRWH